MKTNWKELIMNSTGKLSGSGFIGLITGIVAILGFISGNVLVYLGNKDGLEIMTLSAYFMTIGGTLMGIRRFTVPQLTKYDSPQKDFNDNPHLYEPTVKELSKKYGESL